jgi:hypothetical protein
VARAMRLARRMRAAGFMEGDDYSDAATVVHLRECFKGRTVVVFWGSRAGVLL